MTDKVGHLSSPNMLFILAFVGPVTAMTDKIYKKIVGELNKQYIRHSQKVLF